MKKVLSCTLVFLLFVFTGNVWAQLGGNTSYGAEQWTVSGAGNTFIGLLNGNYNTGSANTFLGFYAGSSNSSGNSNLFLGHFSGAGNSTGSANTFLGTNNGSFQNGESNTFVGYAAGTWDELTIKTGSRNTFIGAYAGGNNSGNDNVFIGYEAGINEIGSNKLYIDNTNTATPLIYGEFDNNIVSVNGKLGVGTQVPVRQIHLAGEQAVFRMDRPTDTAAFMLVRTDAGGTPLKTFVVGANASGSNSGSFVINDLGTSVSGAGTRRLTIDNNGNATFTNSVYAQSFVPASSLAYKTNIKTYENALEAVKKLRGVSFDWKDSGKPSVGLIAEEVDQVIPEVVAHNGKDATGVNYDSLVGVLVEAIKEQEAELKAQQARNQKQDEIIQAQQKINAEHSREIAELKRLLILSNAVSKAD